MQSVTLNVLFEEYLHINNSCQVNLIKELGLYFPKLCPVFLSHVPTRIHVHVINASMFAYTQYYKRITVFCVQINPNIPFNALSVRRSFWLYSFESHAKLSDSVGRGSWASIHYAVRRPTTKSRGVSKPRDWMLSWSYRCEIWQASRQHSPNAKFEIKSRETSFSHTLLRSCQIILNLHRTRYHYRTVKHFKAIW